MAGKGINIQFVSDVAGFLRGTKDVEGALDKVADSLDDITKDAKDAGKDLGDGLKDGAKDAERAVDDLGDKAGDSLEKVGDEAKDAGKKVGDEIEDGTDKASDAGKDLEKKFRDVFDEVKGDARKAGDDVGDETKRGFQRAEQAAEGFKDEARQNFAETASSFDGSMESIADMAQSTLGGLATAIPGAGIALAGLGAAAGVFYAQWQENAEKVKERISEMYADMAASGNRFLSEGFINEKVAEWIDEVDPGRLSQFEAAAADLGIEMSTAVRAINGDAAAAQEVIAKSAEYLSTAQGSARTDVNGLVDAVRTQESAAGSAAAKADLLAASTRASGEAAREFDAAMASLPATVEEANAAVQANIDALGSQEAAADLNKGVLAEMADELDGVRQAAVDAGVSGEDLAAIEEDLAGKFIATATEAGLTEDAARDLARQYDLIPDDVQTHVSAPGVVLTQEQLALAKDTAEKLGMTDPEITVTTVGTGTAQQNLINIRDTVNGIPRLVTINVVTRETRIATGGDFASGGYVGGFPSGGYIDGPGGPIDDRVLARVSRGEYVLDAQTVQQIGAGRLDQINNGQFGPGPTLPGPAAGPTADEIGAAVAQALQGARITLDGVDHLSNAVAARLHLAIQRGVRG